jgi:predicted nucleotidyltransferase
MTIPHEAKNTSRALRATALWSAPELGNLAALHGEHHTPSGLSPKARPQIEIALDGVARHFANAVREHFGERADNVYLYGSAARGDWTPESDVDLLVLLDQVSPADVDAIARLAMEFGLRDHEVLLQPVAMSVERFHHLRERERIYALDVLRDGLQL